MENFFNFFKCFFNFDDNNKNEIYYKKNENDFEIVLFKKFVFVFKEKNNNNNNELNFKLKIIFNFDDKNSFKITKNSIDLIYNKNTKFLQTKNSNIIFKLSTEMIIFLIKKLKNSNINFNYSKIKENFEKINFSLINIFLFSSFKTFKMNLILIEIFLNDFNFFSSNSEIFFNISINFINPINQFITNFIKHFQIIFNYQTNNIKFNSANINLDSLILNIFDLLLNSIIFSLNENENNNNENNNENFIDIYSNLTNRTNNVLLINNLNINEYLLPNKSIEIYYKILFIKLQIDDKNFECCVDLSILYQKIFNQFVLNNNNNNNNNLFIDYISIEMKNKKEKKKFLLFYSIKTENKLKLNLFIFDNLLIFNKFPQNKNLYNFIIDEKNSISSLNFKDYNENNKNIIKIDNNITIALECNNTIFYNLINYDIFILNEEKNVIFQLNSKSEINFNYENDKNLFIKFSNENNQIYISENLNSIINNHINNQTEIYKLKLTNQKNKKEIFIYILIENYFNNQFKKIYFYPHLIFRNLTNINNNEIFQFSFIFNEICNKINNNILTSNNNSEEYQIFYNNNYLLKNILNNDNESNFLLENLNDKIFQIKLCLIYNNSKQESLIYISNNIYIKDNKDFLIPFLIYIDKTNNEFHYFLFRLKIKILFDNLIIISLSSLLNFIPKENLKISFKNKIDLPEINKNIFNYFLEYNSNFISEKSCIDTIYKFKSILNNNNDIIEINDDFLNFYQLLKNIENTIELNINDDFYVNLNLKDLFINEKYYLNAINKYNFDKNKISSKLFKKRVLHFPYFIIEIYNFEKFMNKFNSFIFVENKTNFTHSIYFHAKNSNKIYENEIKKGFQEFYCVNNENILHTLILTVDKNIKEIIKDGIEIYDKNNKEFEGIFYQRINNLFYIILYEKNENLIEKNEISNENKNFNLLFLNCKIKFNLLPFFILKNKNKFKIKIIFEKLLITFKYKKYFNVTFPNLNIINNMKEKNNNLIFKTKFFSDFFFEQKNIFSFNLNNLPKMYEIRLNFPFESEINIDENLIQSLNFFFIQLNTNLFNKNNKNNNNFKNNKKNILLNQIILPKITENFIINTIKFNDFNTNISIEYKKGLDLTIKNSYIKSKKKDIQNIISNSNELINLLKNDILNNLFRNIYSLLTSTEIFGNLNEMFNSFKLGYNQFLERPSFTFGILNFMFEGIKSSVKSFVGIGIGLAKTIKNLNGRNLLEYEIYKGYYDLIISNNSINNVNLISNFLLSFKISNIFNVENEYFNFYFKFEGKLNGDNYVFLLYEFFICLIKFIKKEIKIKYIIPYEKINNISKKNNNEIILNLNENKNIFNFNISNQNDLNYFFNDLLNKYKI